MKKILVAGGAGYIGSCFVEYILQNTDYDVVIVDDLSTGFKESINPRAVFYKGSILDDKLLDKVFDENKILGVFHFAAKLIVPESVEKPIFYWLNNVGGVGKLLDAMVRHDVKNIVFSSTAAVYGFPKEVPVDEEAPKNPCNPYGASKLACESLIQDAAKAYQLNYTILRYFNVAGATSNYGLRKMDPTLLIPVINKSLLTNQPMKIFGNDYQTTKDGTCVRDYIHIEDLVRAHLLAFEHQVKHNESNIFNLGTNEGYTVLEVLKTTETVLKQKVQYSFGPRRPGDPDRLITRNQKIKQLLNWVSAKTLADMIKSDYDFRQKLYKDK